MSTIQIRVDDALKAQADMLFSSLGLDISTAVRIFLNAAVEHNCIPFAVQHNNLPPSLMEAINDSQNRTNLHGPFHKAEGAISSMLGDA